MGENGRKSVVARTSTRYLDRIGRRATAPLRYEPKFLIIGGIRCGTTSLIRYLGQHPCVRIPATKEVHYFDWNFHRGRNWYRSWFPLDLERGNSDVIAGESSPAYLMDPHVPERVAETMPDARIILLVRDPVERAHSHFRLRRSRGFEPRESFSEALADEPRRMKAAMAPGKRSGVLLDSYFHQGEYVVGLERWLAHFDQDQILIIQSERFFADPAASHGEVLEFLDLAPHDVGQYDVHNAAPAANIDPDLRSILSRRYGEANARFYEMIGQDFGWT
ncbi:MAG: sulfotransferase domain-containing protein [Actinomycetota bacterium]